MAKKKVKKTETTAIAKWEEELAKQAEAAAAQEANTGGGQFFSTKGGTLSLNDSPIPGNEIAAVIVDSVLENVYYEGSYDPDNPSGPTCYAFGRVEEEMSPHDDTAEKQSPNCDECAHNQWGSAETGRGKACRNRRRLAIISAGTVDRSGDVELFEDPAHFLKADVAYLALPPTSIQGFGAYVKGIASTLKRPPHAVFTRISLVPDPKTQFKLTFEALGSVPGKLIPAMMTRHEEQRGLIEFPYPKDNAPDKGAKKKGKKKASGKGKGRKY